MLAPPLLDLSVVTVVTVVTVVAVVAVVAVVPAVPATKPAASRPGLWACLARRLL